MPVSLTKTQSFIFDSIGARIRNYEHFGVCGTQATPAIPRYDRGPSKGEQILSKFLEANPGKTAKTRVLAVDKRTSRRQLTTIWNVGPVKRTSVFSVAKKSRELLPTISYRPWPVLNIHLPMIRTSTDIHITDTEVTWFKSICFIIIYIKSVQHNTHTHTHTHTHTCT